MDLKRNFPKRCVHIVDDEPEVRASLALLLSTAGIESEEYASAEEFLEVAPLSEPICVVLDNRLPGVTGLAALPRILAAGGNAAVIMMTGHGDVPSAVAAMKLGAFHFVEKPFDSEMMLMLVEEALARTELQQDVQAASQQFRTRRELLTQREAEVFDLLLDGLPTKSIAARLDITTRTTEHHRSAVMRKFEARSISHLMKMALGASK